MTPQILDWMRAARMRFPAPAGKLLEVGSRDHNGSPRVVFPDASPYIGIDATPGPGVDLILDAERLIDLPFTAWADTVVCCECLEHCVRPWLILDGLLHHLRPGGMLWISTPTFGFPLHRYPLDCYRFGEDAYLNWLFADMELLDLGHVEDSEGSPGIVAVGRPIAKQSLG